VCGGGWLPQRSLRSIGCFVLRFTLSAPYDSDVTVVCPFDSARGHATPSGLDRVNAAKHSVDSRARLVRRLCALAALWVLHAVLFFQGDILLLDGLLGAALLILSPGRSGGGSCRSMNGTRCARRSPSRCGRICRCGCV